MVEQHDSLTANDEKKAANLLIYDKLLIFKECANMAKFNITVDLDWIDNEGGIDNAVKAEIVSAISASFTKELTASIRKEAAESIQKNISNSIDKTVTEITTQLLSRRFDVVDRYGDVTKEGVSVMEMLKEKLDIFLIEPVNNNGQTGGYDAKTPRINYIIQKNINEPMQKKVDQAVENVRKNLELYVEKTIKAQIGESVAKAVGLDRLIKQG